MRIYAVADIHGKNRLLSIIRQNIHRHHPDILVMAGDLAGFFSYHALIPFLNKLVIPVVCILGNSDPDHLKRKISSLIHTRMLDNQPFSFNGFCFIGASGTLPLPFSCRISIRETQILKQLKQLLSPDTILVVHPPPRGILDKVGNRFKSGSRNLRRFIDTYQPFMVICGHIHEQAGFAWSKKTLVVNCAVSSNSFGAMIDISPDRSVTIKILNSADE